MARGRILVLCGRAPWQRNGGALLRNFWMIDALAKTYAVDLVVADEPEPIPASFAAVVDDYACFQSTARQRAGMGRLLRAALPGESSLTAGWTNAAMRDYVAERLGRYPYEAIQTDLSMAAALPRRDVIPVVYNAHNCEAALLRRRAGTEPPHHAAALLIDAARVRRQERALIGRSALVAVCSDDDLADFERFVPNIRRKATVVPNGVDVRGYALVRASAPEPRTVLISGSMDWRPNVLGLRWFLHGVLPRLRACAPNVIVRVAGRMDPALQAELLTYPNVESFPNPVSMEPHLAAASVVAAPIVVSSGTRLRILEAWAAGRPVVTTSAGAFGLGAASGSELIERDEPAAFAESVAAILGSPAAGAALVDRASAFVERYDWRQIGAQLRTAYARVTGEPVVNLRSLPALGEDVVFARGF